MRALILVLTLALVAAFAINGCGGRGSSPADALETPATESGDLVPAGLGSLDGLPDPTHELSVTGPGWFELDLFNTLAASGVVNPHPIDELPLVALSSPAYAIYGIYGFDGDNGPTSLRVSAADISGEYYVGFSDYVNGDWSFSGPFTAAATAEIPIDEDHLSPASFTDENGHCFVTVVAEPGNSLTLTKLELGVHGGVAGPAAPFLYSATSNAGGIMLRWWPSDNMLDPDFAGYKVYRADLYAGDFVLLNPGLTMEDFYHDDTAVEGMVYRYHVGAYDVSGNGNVSSTINYTIDPTAMIDPVPVLDIPHGPFYGPLDLTFDMTASFDPEGDPIDTYEIIIMGSATIVAGADPAPVLTLQPGCYKISVGVRAGPRAGYTYHYFKVYPQWNDPVVAKAATPAYNRGLWFSAGIHPVTGELITSSNDLISDQYLAIREQAGGGLDIVSAWVPNNGYCIQSPVVLGDCLITLVESDTSLQLVRHDGSDANIYYSTSSFEQDAAGLAGDGVNRAWLVVCQETGGDYYLHVIPVTTTSSGYHVTAPVGDISFIDAVYNPVVDALDIVYTLTGSNNMYWVRDDLSGSPVVPVEIVPAATCQAPRIAMNPANGRPLVAYRDTADTFVKFTALQSDLATWTAPELIDGTQPNLLLHQLLLDDGYPVALLGHSDGTLNLYRRGATWLKTNVMADSGVMFAMAALVKVPGASGVEVVYRDTTFSLKACHCEYDGTITQRWELPGIEPLGMELHCAAGSDGLHAVYLDSTMGINHLVSADGSSWSDAAGVGAGIHLDLAGTDTGDVYLAYFDTPSMHLKWWDGATWAAVSSIPTDDEHYSILNGKSGTAAVSFACYDTTLNLMTYQECEHGMAPTSTTVDHGNDIWGGIVDTFSTRACLVKGSSPASSHVYLGTWTLTDEYLAVYGGPSMIFQDDYFSRGKGMQYTNHLTYSLYSDSQCFMFTTSLLEKAVLLEKNGILPDRMIELDLGSTVDRSELRRTVSSLTTPCETSVVLFSNLIGEQVYLAWSNFGDWETLDLPDGVENMMSPELVCGMDGRWHLCYRDWVTDNLMCVSTL